MSSVIIVPRYRNVSIVNENNSYLLTYLLTFVFACCVCVSFTFASGVSLLLVPSRTRPVTFRLVHAFYIRTNMMKRSIGYASWSSSHLNVLGRYWKHFWLGLINDVVNFASPSRRLVKGRLLWLLLLLLLLLLSQNCALLYTIVIFTVNFALKTDGQ